MVTRRRLITSILLLAILGAGLIAPYMVRRTIVHGHFKEFSIGASKIQVFDVLQKKEDISSVSARVPEFRIDHENVEDVIYLYRIPAFMIQSPTNQLRIYHDSGRIKYINRSGVGWQMEGNWKDLNEIVQIIGDFLKRNQDASLIAIPEGRAYSNKTSISIGKFMPQATPEDRNWLFQYDEWFFKEDDRRTHFNLFFERDKLVRVEFRNYLIEFP
jgi:hypothetical protein